MSHPHLQDFVARLKSQIAGEIRLDRYSRILYSTDASIYQIMPLGVVIPRSVEDVHAVVELAAAYRIPLLPRTSGSSLAGQAVNEAVVIDFSKHLNQILEVNPEERWVRVQPGVVLDVLNLHLRPYGLQFGPDPASSNRAAMGGIISNNSTGAHSILYGNTVEHVLETKVILSDGSQAHFRPVDPEQLPQYCRRKGLEGEIYRRIHRLITENDEVIRRGTPRHWRRCGGYSLDRFVSGVSYRYHHDSRFNLARLICGAEGTLAVITEAKLNLVPLPGRTALGLVHFHSLHEALSAVPIILETEPSAVELLDNLGLTLCREVPEYARLMQTFMEGSPHCLLITEYYGREEQELARKVQHLSEHLRRHNVRCTVVPALEPWRQQNVWTVRKVGLGLMMKIKGDYKPIPFIEDAAVPVEHLAEYVARIERFCNELGTRVAYYAHASAGCIHVRPLINLKKQEEVDKLPQIAAFSAELVGGYGGALSSEHGDGRCRSWLNERFFGKELYGLFKQVKQIFDPQNLLNPG
ncbi:MAG: FAD-binding oxidoreductase, partial [Calditrichaeota bacterium]